MEFRKDARIFTKTPYYWTKTIHKHSSLRGGGGKKHKTINLKEEVWRMRDCGCVGRNKESRKAKTLTGWGSRGLRLHILPCL